MMELKAGSRWKSAICDTELVVVKPPSRPVSLECGGQPMLPQGAEMPARAAISEAFSSGTLPGKRFADEETGLEVLSTKGGAGSLSLNGRELPVKDPKKLPASD